MRNIFLLILLLAGCSEDVNDCKKQCIQMTISDSLPFQFWVNGQQTYNEKQICGVYKACFCQPWLCDNEVVLQFTDTVQGQELNLSIRDENDSELYNLPFVDTEVFVDVTDEIDLQFSTTSFTSGLGDWINNDGSDGAAYIAWTSASPGARANGSPSGQITKYLAILRSDGDGRGWPAGEYSIKINGSNNSGGTQTVSPSIYGMNTPTDNTQIVSVNSNSLPDGGAATDITITFTLDDYWQYLAIRFNRDGPPGGGFYMDVTLFTATILSAPTSETYSVYSNTAYDLSFVPSELSPELCNSRVQFVVESSLSSGVDPHTDCIDIRQNHDCLIEITYSNTNNFDGINYESGSPTPVFTALIPAQFWKEDNPQEQEDSVLSNGVIVTRRTEIQEKTLLEVGFVPNYFHKKIQKILMHNSVQIEDVNGDLTYWKKRDGYESENLNRYPLKVGSVWLTKYNSVEKNTI